MNEHEYDTYKRLLAPPEPMIHADRIPGGARTLTLGYDGDRTTVHVWLTEQDGVPNIGLIRYRWDGDTWFYGIRPSWDANALRPTKRSYVESTDFFFAQSMHDSGTPLSFTTPNWENDAKRRAEWAGFAGKVSP